MVTERTGTLWGSLSRTSDQINNDRAETLFDEIKFVYGRQIEDIERLLEKLTRKRKNAFDLSNSETCLLMKEEDFNTIQFVFDDVKMSVRLEQLKEELTIATQRYQTLFK